MSEEEKMKIAIDLEEIEKSCLDLAKWFKPIIDLAVKNKKYWISIQGVNKI